MNKTVAILGASDKPDRYAYLAQQRLMAAGYTVWPVSARIDTVLGVDTVAGLAQLPAEVDTLTVYVGAKAVASLSADIVAGGFRRVIFNPGTEEPATMQRLRDAGVEVVEGCTLVMLRTGQF